MHVAIKDGLGDGKYISCVLTMLMSISSLWFVPLFYMISVPIGGSWMKATYYLSALFIQLPVDLQWSQTYISMKTKQWAFGINSLGFEFCLLVNSPLCLCVYVSLHVLWEREKKRGIVFLNLFWFWCLHFCFDFHFVRSWLNIHFFNEADFISRSSTISVSLPTSSQCLIIPHCHAIQGIPFLNVPLFHWHCGTNSTWEISVLLSQGDFSPVWFAHLPGSA